MYRKNTGSQFVCFQMLLTASGAIATGLSPTVRRCIDGTFAAGGGTVTEDTGTGGYKYAMAQADTNGNDISLFFTATGAMPVCVNFVTTAADPTDAVKFGLSNLDATVSSRLAAGSYTAPDNADIVSILADVTAGTTTIFGEVGAIKAKTDNLPASPAAVGSAMTLTSGERNSVADALLNRDLGLAAGASAASRYVLDCFRALRNKVSISGTTLTVTTEDDATSAWTAVVTSSAGANPITGIDPV